MASKTGTQLISNSPALFLSHSHSHSLSLSLSLSLLASRESPPKVNIAPQITSKRRRAENHKLPSPFSTLRRTQLSQISRFWLFKIFSFPKSQNRRRNVESHRRVELKSKCKNTVCTLLSSVMHFLLSQETLDIFKLPVKLQRRRRKKRRIQRVNPGKVNDEKTGPRQLKGKEKLGWPNWN